MRRKRGGMALKTNVSWKWHIKEKQFIITHDVDFGTLAINEGVSCYGIIYLRLKNLKVSNVINILEKLFMVDKDIPEGSVIVVEDTRLRIRTI